MYRMDGRIRYSEVGHDGVLTLTGLINYMQDCNTFQSQDIGLGLEKLYQMNRVWVLSGWQIVIDRLPRFAEGIEVATWPYAFKGFMGLRNYELTDANGKRLAVANSVWTLVDWQERTPVRIEEQDIAGYELEPKAQMEYMPRKIRLEGNGEEGQPLVVTSERIDTNGHMNNGHYVGIAAQYLPQDILVRQIRVEYKQEVRLADELIPILYRQERGLAVELQREAKACAIVEFTW